MTTLQAHRIETTLTQDGQLTLDHLPFRAGETVEIIVLTNPAGRPIESHNSSEDRYPLRGTTIKYIDPFDSIAEADWEVLQ
jgi:hypothetical protein